MPSTLGGVLRLGGVVLRPVTRAASDATLAVVDGVLESRLARDIVDRALAGPLLDTVARDLARYAVLERLADPLLDGETLDRVAEAALESPAMDRLVARVIDSRLVDEAVAQLLESEELWLVVEEVARSPAVTEAITQQGIGFADQVAGGVRARSRNADELLERVARRALRRAPAPPSDAG